MSEHEAARRPEKRMFLRIATAVAATVGLLSVIAHLGVGQLGLEESLASGSFWDWTERDGVHVRAGISVPITRPVPFVVHTDERGARVVSAGDHVPEPVDVVVVGCSFAFGWGVDAEETFAAVVGKGLQVSVANLAFPGASTATALRAFERNAALRPRVVVYAFIEDHARRNLATCAPVAAAGCLSEPHVVWRAGAPELTDPVGGQQEFLDTVERGTLFARNRWIDAPWIAGMFVTSLAVRAMHPVSAPEEHPGTSDAALAYLIAILDASVREHGAVLIVLHVPSSFTGNVTRLPEGLRRAIPTDARLVDAEPAFSAHLATRGARLHIERDGHPNAIAHRLLAGVLQVPLEQALRERSRIH